MTESLNVSVDRRDGLAVIYTEGYINDQGGEEVAKVSYELMLGFCCLTPTIDTTFQIMGLAQYAPIFADEASAVAELGAG